MKIFSFEQGTLLKNFITFLFQVSYQISGYMYKIVQILAQYTVLVISVLWI